MRAMIPRAIANTSDLEGLFANIVPYVKKKSIVSKFLFSFTTLKLTCSGRPCSQSFLTDRPRGDNLNTAVLGVSVWKVRGVGTQKGTMQPELGSLP